MIRVREYAYLTTRTVISPSLDLAQIDEKTFEWLGNLIAQEGEKRVASFRDPQTIKLASHVGYIESPSGVGIEVLPKTRLGEEDPALGRKVLKKMLSAALNIPNKEAGEADLLRSNSPIHEWIYKQFLEELKRLLIFGLRGHYSNVSEVSSYIRGRLNLSKQQRQPPGRQHLLHLSRDIFLIDKIENRLIKTALQTVVRHSKTSETWRVANEFSHRLDELEPVVNPIHFLPQWADNKLMKSYRGIKPWCSLILEKLNPDFQKGKSSGISLLFPMERLFESFVGAKLKRSVALPWRLTEQAQSKYLLDHKAVGSHKTEEWFRLKPDFLFTNKSERIVADAKWKLISSLDNKRWAKYGLSQTDMYQMFAYGNTYLPAVGNMILIYPKHKYFEEPLPVFSFSESLQLWVVPFCIETGEMQSGLWSKIFESP
jgi:5-methylcytosine-specific restriction enzyme subunit McrC